jgi:large subunit ribosomal protein L19
MNPVVKDVEAAYLREDIPYFRPGDTVRVSVRIVEGNRERVQDYEGVVIAKKGDGARESFTVRRISFGVGMERVFQLHSPRIEGVKVTRRSKVRRAKLYYLRDLRGKKARLTERRVPQPKLAAESVAGKKSNVAQIAAAKANAPAPAAPVAETKED